MSLVSIAPQDHHLLIPPLLSDCQALDWYWASWGNGQVAVGKGMMVGNNTIASGPGSEDIRAVGIAASDSNPGATLWEFDEPQVTGVKDT